MEMQITETSPAVRSALRLLLNSFVALKKKRPMCKPGCSKFECVGKRRAKLQRL